MGQEIGPYLPSGEFNLPAGQTYEQAYSGSEWDWTREAAQKTEEAGDGVWDTITSVVTNIAEKIPDLTQSWVDMEASKLDAKLEEAKANTLNAAARASAAGLTLQQYLAGQQGGRGAGGGGFSFDFLKNPYVIVPTVGVGALLIWWMRRRG